MTISFTATDGTGLFDRMGDMGKTFVDNDDALDAFKIRVIALVESHTASTTREAESGLLADAETIQAQAAQPWQEPIRARAQQSFIDIVDADEPLAVKDMPHALRVCDRQMRENSQGMTHNIAGSAVSAQTGNTGNGNVVVGLYDHRGNPLKFPFTETLRLECVQDAQPNGGAAEGAEVFQVSGKEPLPFWHPDWPGGSGNGPSIRSTAGSISNGSRPGENLVVNGDFENTTATNAFAKWEIVAGAAGSTVLETSTAYIGTKGLEFAGDGSTLIHVRQKLGNPEDGTPIRLKPQTPYCLGFYIRHGGTSATTGAMDVKLTATDGTVVSVTPDHGSTIEAKVTVDLTSTTAVTSSYQFKSVSFVTPFDLPENVELRQILTTALPSSRSIYIDDVVVQEQARTYVGGPYVGVHRGSTAWVQGDTMNVAVTNNNSKTNLIYALDRMLGIRETGETLASLATATIGDGLLA